jgi:hypothetical protein
MGKAYECDKCNKFFPGVGFERYLPKSDLWNRETPLELCKFCANDYDTRIREMVRLFTSGRVKRKGNIKNDPGHEYEQQT